MNLLAIDPGTTESAYVLLDLETEKPINFGKVDNEWLLDRLRTGAMPAHAEHLAIEKIGMGGMTAGQETFDTAEWIGRFIEAWSSRGGPFTRIRRYDEKVLLCGTVRAKDKNIRQALIDRYGGPTAIGKKSNPGPLYGVAADVWQALAVAITWKEIQRESRAA